MEYISLRRVIFLFTMSVAFIAAFIRKVNPQITIFHHRAIGNAVLNGVDPRVYVSSFYVCIIIFFAVFWAGNFIINQLKKLALNRNFDYEYSLVSDFSFITLINMIIFLYDVLQSKTVLVIPFVIFAAFAFVILHAFLNIILPEKFTVNENDESKQLWTSVIFLLPVFLTYSARLMMTYARGSTVSLRSPVSLILYAVFYITARLFIRKKSVINASANALVPLSFLPVTYIAANEIQYTLTKHGIQTDPVQLALIFSAVIILSAIMILIRPKSYSINESESLARIENIVLPVLLVTFSLFMAHKQTIAPGFDYLHDGNDIVPAQQLYEFGVIPCLDYWAPVHWPIGAYIYTLLNGFNFFEITLGNRIFEAIALTILCYFTLRKFTGGTFAAVLICFTPMLQYMDLYYCSSFLPLLYLNKMMQNKRVRDYAVIAVLSMLSFAFMPSSGKIAVLTSIIMIILSCTDRNDFINAVKGCLGVILVSGALYFALVILRGGSISDRIKLIQSFADCDIEIGAWWVLFEIRNSPFEIMTCYGLLSIISILALIFALRINDKKNIHYALIYILIASLVSVLRVFARHSLLEGNQFLFFPFVFCVIPIVFINSKVLKRTSLFLIILLIVYTPYVNSSKSAALFNGNHGVADAGVRNFEFVTWKPGDVRCDTTGNTAYPRNLRKVLDSVLSENQTFFDGINAHLLYALMEREAPFLHHSVQLIFNEPGQEAYIHQFEKDYESGRIPIAVSYYINENVMNQSVSVLTDIDVIPIELSIYKLHEFINTHYEPWLIVDNFCLMKAKNSNIEYEIPEGSENIIPYSTVKQNTSMRLLPFIWGNYDAKTSEHFPEELQVIAQSAELKRNIPQTFMIDPDTDKSDGNYLYFRITAERDELLPDNYRDEYRIGLLIYLRAEKESAGTFSLSYGDGKAKSSFFIVPGTHDYLVRISCQYEWMSAEHNEITITSTIPALIEKFSVLRGD